MSDNDIHAVVAPHSSEAEQSVLGGLMIDANAIDRLPRGMTDTAFYTFAHRLIFRACIRLAEKGRAIDVVSVYEALRDEGKADEVGGIAYLNTLAQNTPGAANVHRYAEIVRDHAMRRSLINAANDISSIAFNPDGRDTKQLLDQSALILSAVTDHRPMGSEPVRAVDAFRTHIDTLDRRFNKDESVLPVSLGFEHIDQRLSGGIRRGELVVVAGRPSHGKTAFAMNCGTNVSRSGHPVLVVSLEMTMAQLMDRQAASIGRIPLTRLISGNLHDTDWPLLTSVGGVISDMKLSIDDTPAQTLLDIRSKARRHKRKCGLDLLIVDYLQLIEGSPKESEYDRVSRVSPGLKSLAKELDCTVMALSQLSRNGAGKRPTLSDLRGSGAIEQDADVVMFVYREEKDNPDTPMKGLGEIIIDKQRQGECGSVVVTYEGAYTKFADFSGSRPVSEAPRRAKRGIE